MRVDPEILDLYSRYLDARHPGSPMESDDAEGFREMLLAPWAETVMMLVRHADQLIAVAITDVTPLGCSAVYTFFDSDAGLKKRSLGTFAILRQIDWVRGMGLPHLYLGYWIDTHPAMHYKQRFQPQQHLTPSGWLTTPTA